jgi:hypothetical protein
MIIDSSRYQLRKLIVEIRHPANLLHSQNIGSALQELVPDFEQVAKTGGELPDTVELMNKASFCRIGCEWNKLVYVQEQLADVASGSSNFKKYLSHIISRLGIEVFSRVGVRTFFMFSVDNDYDHLLKWYNDTFLNSIDSYAVFGKIADTGPVVLNGSDDRYKFNLNIAPMAKDEFRNKLSDFKSSTDTMGNALLVDLDLYFVSKGKYKPVSIAEDAIEQARIKVVQFIEQFSKKK